MPAINEDHRARIEQLAEIVRDGNVERQTGTELDRKMLRMADHLMDQDVAIEHNESTIRELFSSGGRDHQIVHDHLLGTHGDDGNDFLHDVNKVRWEDNGKAAADLFSWTNEQHNGPQSDIASATAEKYAQYVGAHKDELLHMSSGFHDKTLGQVNPELVKGYAHGLTPYMADIASVSGGAQDNFDPLDAQESSERPLAKGLFAVLGTQQEAYVEFNGAADKLSLEKAQEWAHDVKEGVHVEAHDSRLLASATLRGLVDSGTAEGLHAANLNNAEAAEWRQQAYDAGVKGLAAMSGPAGGVAVETFGSSMQEAFLGKPPDTSTPDVPDMFNHEADGSQSTP